MNDFAAMPAGSGGVLVSGDRLGPYEILAPLGAGGMGEVYRARDPRLGREVAIKIISNRIANDPHALRRFENEAKAVASLSHPNILAIHDFQTENGISFAVMELLRGESLADRLSRERLSSRSVVEIGAAVADGLASAHARGIVHRDLKPANVFLTKDGQVKILDFGLAKRSASIDSTGQTDVPTESQPGTVLGTIGYMAPEQVSGAPLDGRADIFALGCILYEMISGDRAFARSSAVATLAAILHDNPRELSDSRFAPIVGRCLQKSPDERFQSARDLAFALRSGTSGTAGLPAQGARRFSRRALWTAAAIAVVVAAAVTFGVVHYRTTRQPIGSLAVLPFANTSRDPQTEFLAEGMTDTIINKLAELPQLKVMSHSTMFRFKGKEADPQQVGRELNVASVLTGRIVQIGNRLNIETELVNVADGTQLWGERYDRPMRDVFALQDDIAQQISQKLRLKVTGEEQKRLAKRDTDDPTAYSLYVQGRFYLEARTGASIRKAIDQFNAAVQRDPNYALGYVGLADAHALLPAYEGGPYLPELSNAKEAAMKALSIDPNLAEAHATLGLINMFLWQWQDAEDSFKRSIRLKPNYANAHHWYAFELIFLRRPAECIAEFRKAQALDPLSAINNVEMATALSNDGQHAEAIALLRQTIRLNPEFRLAHLQLGRLYMTTGQTAEGFAELQALGQANLAIAFARVGRRSEALDLIRELQQRNQAGSIQVANVYAAFGDRPNAYRWYEQALREHEFVLAEINSDHQFDSWRSDPQFQQLLRGMNLAR